jgi:hypothetical protein
MTSELHIHCWELREVDDEDAAGQRFVDAFYSCTVCAARAEIGDFGGVAETER